MNDAPPQSPKHKKHTQEKLHACMVKIPEEMSLEIDEFCQRFNLSRTAWFHWAISTQYLVYKKMMKEAGCQKEGPKSNEP